MLGTLEDLKNLKNGATMFGKFYPKDYLVAAFSCPEDADQAVHALQGLGFASDDIVVCDGELILAHQAEILENRTFIDRFLGKFADHDSFGKKVERASHRDSDYRFVLIYAPTKEKTQEATDAICTRAVFAQKYDAMSFNEIVVGNAEGSHCKVPTSSIAP